MSATRSKSDRLSWFKMDAGAFLTKTTGLSSAHVGIYARLQMVYWTTGNQLPAEPTRLKRQLGISTEADEIALKEVLAEFFPEGRNETLDNYLDEVLTRSKVQSALAHRSWENRRKGAKPTAVTSKANPQQELCDDPDDF